MPPSAAAVDQTPDLLDPAFWSRPHDERAGIFERLRGLPRPEFVRQQIPGLGPTFGYYALVKHADIVEVSRRPRDFSSEGATSIVGLPPELHEFYGSMINMDNPEHARLRRIVARAFGHGTVAGFESAADRIARRIVAELAERGPGDFVRDVAAEMPIAVLSEMMGVPPEDYEFLYTRSNRVVGPFDPDYVAEGEDPAAVVMDASRELGDYITRLGRERAAHPRDDLITKLVRARVDGESLTRQELVSFFILLVIAGMETTRNAISHALVLLTRHPGQRALLLSDYSAHAAGAADEVLRLATPINWMRRIATRDCEMNGHRFRRGDRMFLFYWSANRDEEVFDDPYRFDLTRSPNPHLAFGSLGPHFCLGAHLARMEMTVLYRELLRTLPEIRAEGEPRRLESSFLEGIKSLKCTF
ncbi:cytochrome P450 [Actinomadura graeca]|uniref:Cytochrome P450 n=1 Tax=Actinomadura graeca TaxID=2750812 RepID=A0ABX8R7H1_9ACTN|nr:cytochrome P450 [Actinomadura graeca]